VSETISMEMSFGTAAEEEVDEKVDDEADMMVNGDR
jgi:hypothetical protein